MSIKRISVIMPIFNRAWCVADAIESVLAIREDGLELVLVDDGSSDDTPEIVSSYARLYPDIVSVYKHDDGANHGIARSRNLGIQKSRGEFLAFLDSDDIYFPHRFSYAISWLENNPEKFGCVEPYIVQDVSCSSDDARKEHVAHLTAEPNKNNNWLKAMLFRSIYWTMPVITLRKNAITRFGWFDERIRVAEEVALWLKLAAANAIGVAQCKNPVAGVRRHASHSWSTVDRKIGRTVYLHALVDAISWVEKQKLSSQLSADLMREKLRTHVIELLSDPGLPLSLRAKSWLLCVRTVPSFLHDRHVTANLVRAPLR